MTQLPAATPAPDASAALAIAPDGKPWADYSTEITVEDRTVRMKVAIARPADVMTDSVVLGDREGLGPNFDALAKLRICSVYLRGDIRVCNHGTFTIDCASPADAEQFASNVRTLVELANSLTKEQAKRLDACRAEARAFAASADGQSVAVASLEPGDQVEVPAPHPVPVADEVELAALCEMGLSRSDAACIQLAIDGLYLVNLGELKHAAKHAPTERGTRLRALPVLAQCAEHLQRVVREDAAFNAPKS